MITKKISLPIILAISISLSGAQTADDAIHLVSGQTGIGSRALAMGGAYTALADDYYSIYWNPAGLALQTQPSFTVEMSHLNLLNEAAYSGTNTSNRQTYTHLRSLGMAWPIPTSRGSMVFALGYNRVSDFDQHLLFTGFSNQSNGLGFDIAVDDEESQHFLFDQNIRQTERVDLTGGIKNWSFGGAVALSPQLMAGASISILGGGETYIQQYSQTDEQNRYNQYPADFNEYTVNRYLETSIRGIQMKLGGTLLATRWLRFGGTVTMPVAMRLEETYSSDDKLEFDDGFLDETEDSGRWDYTIIRPFEFNVGAALSLRYLSLSGDVDYRDWSQVKFDVNNANIDDSDYREYIAENSHIRQNYRPVMNYHAGVELRLPAVHTILRAGYAYYQNPLRDGSYANDQEIFSGGASFAVDRNVSMDFSYRHGWWEQTSYGSYTPQGTTELLTSERFLMGLSIKF